MRTLLLLALVCAHLVALEVGDKAPALDTVTWVAGNPVTLGQRITIVEFWATWCAPCRTSIPHLTKLAAAEPTRLTVVGLSNEEPAVVIPFVKRMGAQMRYPIGVVDEKLHAAYMEGHPGIPFAFLVDETGVVIWKGHPLAIRRPLSAVLAGTFDRVAEARRAAQAAELQTLLQEDPGIDEANLLDRILAKTAEILADDPLAEEAFDLRLGIAEHRKDNALMRSTFAAVPLEQLDTARAAALTDKLLAASSPEWCLPDLAWHFAQRAVAADANNAGAHAALAAVLHSLGRLEDAITSQMQATALNPETHAATLGYYRELLRIRELLAAGKPVTPPPLTAPSPQGVTPASLIP